MVEGLSSSAVVRYIVGTTVSLSNLLRDREQEDIRNKLSLSEKGWGRNLRQGTPQSPGGPAGKQARKEHAFARKPDLGRQTSLPLHSSAVRYRPVTSLSLPPLSLSNAAHITGLLEGL